MLKDAEKTIRKLSYKPENMPLFVSDGLRHYKTALLKEYGMLKRDKYPRDGRFKYSTAMVPANGLRYGQFVKVLKEGEIIRTEKRSVFGNVDKKDITTSIVERLNLTLRQELNRFSGKTSGHQRARST